MISAILSIVLGLLPFALIVPKIISIFGLALGLNSFLKEMQKDDAKKWIKTMAVSGGLLSALSLLAL